MGGSSRSPSTGGAPLKSKTRTRVKDEAPRRVWKGRCKRDGTCVLPKGHGGDCHAGVFETEMFTIESIRSERDSADGGLEYAIKWEGWPAEDMTWESAKEIKKSAPNAVRDWEDLKKELDQKWSKKKKKSRA